MPWWGYLIIVFVLVDSIITSAIMGCIAFDKNLKERMTRGKEVYCLYSVREVGKQITLFCGSKFRVVSDLPQVYEYRQLFKKVYVFQRETEICGVECEISYWVGDKPDKELICVTAEGRKVLENFVGYGEVFNAGT